MEVEVSYSKDTYHTYMVIVAPSENRLEDEEKMLENQQSDVLLSFHMQQLNSKKDYYYDITGKIDLKSYLSKQQVDKEMAVAIIQMLLHLYQAVEEYLLNMDSLLMDIEYIYTDIEEKRFYVAYLPGQFSAFNQSLKDLSACLLEHTNHTDREGVLLIYDFYQIVRREDFTPDLLKGFIKNSRQGQQDDAVKSNHNKDISQDDIKEQMDNQEVNRVINGYEDAQLKKESEQMRQRKSYLGIGILGLSIISILLLYRLGKIRMLISFTGLSVSDKAAALGLFIIILLLALLSRVVFLSKDKQVLSTEKESASSESDKDRYHHLFDEGSIYSFTDETIGECSDMNQGKTVVLSDKKGQICLVSLDSKETADLYVTTFPSIIGNQESDCQIVIDKVGISRRHAKLEKIGGDIFLTDLGSTNGTCINGKRLKKDEKQKLYPQDMVEFANTHYVYDESRSQK